MLTVAIIGRPNVGKSTLFNRLTGAKRALVDDTPGVTRDRRQGVAHIGPLTFYLLDTAGLEEAAAGSLQARMTEHSLRALQEADIALLVVDGRAGITPEDKHFAAQIRRAQRRCVVLVNKAEGRAAEHAVAEAYALGLGDPVPISAEHGEGLPALYDALTAHIPAAQWEEAEEETSPHAPTLAIIGRPNAGKSTLVNTLLKEERVLTGPEAGITRDAIHVPFSWRGKPFTLVDTAGMRKRAKTEGKLEKLSVAETLRSIRFAPCVVLLMDATQALEKQDLQIAELVEREGRALVLAINKWDLVPAAKRTEYLKAVEERLEETLAQLSGVPIVSVSATRGTGVDALMNAVETVLETWNRRIPTGELNRWLEEALSRHAPPLIQGKRLKIRYMTQPKSRPPSFTLFTNAAEIPAHYTRYLAGSLRKVFDLHGVPLRFVIRKGKNPYEGKRDS